MRSLVVVVGLVACGYNNPGSNTDGGVADDGGSDAGSGTVQPACVLPALSADTAATLSGCADAGTQDGIRGVARFSNPVNVAIGASGIAYVADFDSSRLRKIDADGKVTTIYAPTTFNRPFGMVMSTDGYLYVECDNDAAGNHNDTSGTIWKINPAMGTGTQVTTGLTRPRGLAMRDDHTLVVTDYLRMVVETIDIDTQAVTILAGAGVEGSNNGHGTNATFGVPWDLVVDQSTSNLLVTEFDNHVIRQVTPGGDVTVYAGTVGTPGFKDGTLAEALFDKPKGMTIDAQGTIYITDSGNHAIRKISHGMVTTVSGKIEGGYADAADPMSALYYGIEGLDVTPDGHTLIVADGNDGDGSAYNHVRKITLP